MSNPVCLSQPEHVIIVYYLAYGLKYPKFLDTPPIQRWGGGLLLLILGYMNTVKVTLPTFPEPDLKKLITSSWNLAIML